MQEQGFHEGWDEEWQSWTIDEDRLLDHLEEIINPRDGAAACGESLAFDYPSPPSRAGHLSKRWCGSIVRLIWTCPVTESAHLLRGYWITICHLHPKTSFISLTHSISCGAVSLTPFRTNTHCTSFETSCALQSERADLALYSHSIKLASR